MPSTPANAMRISNQPNPAISTSLLSAVGMRPTRDTAIVFILPFPNGIPETSAPLIDSPVLAHRRVAAVATAMQVAAGLLPAPKHRWNRSPGMPEPDAGFFATVLPHLIYAVGALYHAVIQ